MKISNEKQKKIVPILLVCRYQGRGRGWGQRDPHYPAPPSPPSSPLAAPGASGAPIPTLRSPRPTQPEPAFLYIVERKSSTAWLYLIRKEVEPVLPAPAFFPHFRPQDLLLGLPLRARLEEVTPCLCPVPSPLFPTSGGGDSAIQRKNEQR